MTAASLSDTETRPTTLRRPPALVVVGALVGLGVGWLLNGWLAGTRGVVITGEFSGTVSGLSASEGKLCVQPDGEEINRCSILIQAPDASRLSFGDQVRVAVARIKLDAGTSTEVFILESSSN